MPARDELRECLSSAPAQGDSSSLGLALLARPRERELLATQPHFERMFVARTSCESTSARNDPVLTSGEQSDGAQQGGGACGLRYLEYW